MNVDPPVDSSPLDVFVYRLDSFRRECGGPPLREVARISRRMAPPSKEIELQPLSTAALSDVFQRKRKRPQSWRWVATFVLACHQHAVEGGLAKPGDAELMLPLWNEMLQAVNRGEHPGEDEDSEAGIPVEDIGQWVPSPPKGPGPPAGRAGTAVLTLDDLQTVELQIPAPAPIEGSRDAQSSVPEAVSDFLDAYADPGGPSLSEQRMFRQYGQHGVILLRAAERLHDAEAARRLGVLLSCDDCPSEAMFWLMQAERDGDRTASKLIEHCAPRRTALEEAFQLGLQAYDHSTPEVARVYVETAARNGHARAAYNMAVFYMEDDQRHEASYWFNEAVENGYGLASYWYEVNEEARRRDEKWDAVASGATDLFQPPGDAP